MKRSKYYSTTPLSELTKNEIKKVIDFSVEYCVNNLGFNNRKRKQLEIHYCDTNPYFFLEVFGEYDAVNNMMYLYGDTCNTVGKLCSTVIHEYTHFLQPVLTKYKSANDEYGYLDNPFEVEARENQNKYNRYLLREMRETL